VDVKAVATFAQTLPDVVVSKDVKEHKLNRVMVAACSPRMHEGIYRKLTEEAGPIEEKRC
jgi:heterodisulfide reductase subunit A